MKKYFLFLFLFMLFPLHTFAQTCGDVQPVFNFEGIVNASTGELQKIGGYFSTTPFYGNLLYLTISDFPGGSDRFVYYYYDKNYKYLGFYSIKAVGDLRYKLNPDYYYRFTYHKSKLPDDFLSTIRITNCSDSTFGGMLNNLTFGSSTFFDTISTITPFLIVMIAFALGFLLLKKLIKRGSHGHA